jgi:hypothetical protein
MKIKPTFNSVKTNGEDINIRTYHDKFKKYECYVKSEIPKTKLTVATDRITIKLIEKDKNNQELINKLVMVADKLQSTNKTMRGTVLTHTGLVKDKDDEFITMYDDKGHFNIKFYFKDLVEN